jgi:hypothetical protein
MNILLALVCLLAIIALVVGIVLRDWLRSRALAQQARVLGFFFAGTAKPFLGAELNAAPFLDDGPRTRVFNVISGSFDSREFLLFDLYGHGTETPLASSVAAFCWRGAPLPAFEVAPVMPLGCACAGIKGPRLVLSGTGLWRRVSIRNLGDAGQLDLARLRSALEPLEAILPRYRVACCPEWIFVCRPGKKIRPSAVNVFLQESSRIAAAVLEGVGGKHVSASSGA